VGGGWRPPPTDTGLRKGNLEMTAQAIPATHVAASTPSISARPRTTVALDDGDVSVTVTFRPAAPIGSTEVVASLDLPDDTALLTLLDSAIARLIAYRAAYHLARAEDAATAPLPPLPLPTPWYAW